MDPAGRASEEVAELRARLAEALENLDALREGEADALVGTKGVISLAGAERPYQVFFEAMKEGGLTLDASGRILNGNAGVASLLETGLDQLRGGLLLDWVAARDRGKVVALLAARTAGSTRACLLTRNQAQRPVRLSLQPLDLAGQPIICLMVDDLREQDAIEAERTESESFNRAILDSVRSEIAVLAPDGTIIAVNEAWKRFALDNRTGTSADRAGIGVNYLGICREGAAASPEGLDAAEGIRAVLERRRPGFVVEYPCHSPDEERWFSMSVTPLGRGDLGAVVAHTDITRTRASAREMLSLQDQLQQAQKMESLGLLAGGIAHDMNNVLGAILCMASLNLERHPPDSPAYRAFDSIAAAATRGGNMVKGLLGYARQTPAEDRELDLNLILREEASLLGCTTLSKVQIDLELAEDLRPMRGDPGALANLVMNLCLNALDAMPEKGRIGLRTRNVDPDWIELEVEDSGTGMTRETLEKAIYPFFTTKVQGKGTGLGLSMVFGTVKAHGGSLDLRSEPGQGTCVSMRFPACPTLAPAAPRAPGPRAPSGPLAVLLVDDDDMVGMATRMILEFLGHQVTSAASGETALARLATGFRPDLVILDLNMPGLGGKGTLPRLRLLAPEVPVLLSSGRVDQEALELLGAFPHVALLSKPYTIDELAARIHAATRATPP
jgi:signal transduction histidine kinase/CheY-like chemotaxis protein